MGSPRLSCRTLWRTTTKPTVWKQLPCQSVALNEHAMMVGQRVQLCKFSRLERIKQIAVRFLQTHAHCNRPLYNLGTCGNSRVNEKKSVRMDNIREFNKSRILYIIENFVNQESSESRQLCIKNWDESGFLYIKISGTHELSPFRALCINSFTKWRVEHCTSRAQYILNHCVSDATRAQNIKSS